MGFICRFWGPISSITPQYLKTIAHKTLCKERDGIYGPNQRVERLLLVFAMRRSSWPIYIDDPSRTLYKLTQSLDVYLPRCVKAVEEPFESLDDELNHVRRMD